jgi:hypothetical protein
LASEKDNSYSGPLTKRGFFEADISLRTYERDDGIVGDARVKEVVSTGPLLPLENKNFVRRDRDKLASVSLENAAMNSDDLAMMSPDNIRKADATVEAEKTANRDSDRDAGMAPGI